MSPSTTWATPRTVRTVRLPISEVREHALAIMDALVEDGVKLLVIACNTASAAVLRDARERFSRERGVPGRRGHRSRRAPCGDASLGLVASASSAPSPPSRRARTTTPSPRRPSVRVTSQACPRFVSFVEQGITSGPEVIEVAREYLAPLQEAGVDTLILGCTHYPMLQGALSYVMGEDVTLVDSATETAMDVYRALVAAGLERSVDRASRPPLLRDGPHRGVRGARPTLPRAHRARRGAAALMRLTIVGCAGSVAGPDNPASCYVLEADRDGRTWRLLLDLGSGAFGPLQAVVDPAALDGILVSHGHPDHCADLASLSVLLRYGPARDTGLDAIPLWGPEGIDERIRQIEGSTDDAGLAPFAWSPLRAGRGPRALGPLTVTAARAWHPVPALAYRIEGPAESGGAATARLHGRHRPVRRGGGPCRGRRPAAGRGRLGAPRATTRRESTSPALRQANLRAARGVDRLVVTHVASWVDPGADARAGPRRTCQCRCSRHRGSSFEV